MRVTTTRRRATSDKERVDTLRGEKANQIRSKKCGGELLTNNDFAGERSQFGNKMTCQVAFSQLPQPWYLQGVNVRVTSVLRVDHAGMRDG